MVSIAVGIVVVLAVIAGVFYAQRGSHLELQGKVLKVRTAPLDENSGVAVIDFRITNPADFTFQVRAVTVAVEDNSGMRTQGTTISEVDAQRLFQAVPLLGQKYNPSLLMRDEIGAHATEDRMIAARFEVPEAALEKRKQLTVRIEESGGLISEIKEK
ncbi:MAG: hypothetical protein C5B51_26025 [Terriglobia bacterium]|nr:MAG: hypothetical protein C5B51_26025 [Terriglobia bacterium]